MTRYLDKNAGGEGAPVHTLRAVVFFLFSVTLQRFFAPLLLFVFPSHSLRVRSIQSAACSQ